MTALSVEIAAKEATKGIWRFHSEYSQIKGRAISEILEDMGANIDWVKSLATPRLERGIKDKVADFVDLRKDIFGYYKYHCYEWFNKAHLKSTIKW